VQRGNVEIRAEYLIKQIPLDKSKSSAALPLWLLIGLAALVVIGSNPLYILSCFTESVALPTIEAVTIFFILATAIGFIVILETSRADQMDLNWLLLQGNPFFVTGLLCFANIFFRSIQSSALWVLGFMKATALIVFGSNPAYTDIKRYGVM
jgi:hypothetical protein